MTFQHIMLFGKHLMSNELIFKITISKNNDHVFFVFFRVFPAGLAGFFPARLTGFFIARLRGFFASGSYSSRKDKD
jgi:hypothetical protein